MAKKLKLARAQARNKPRCMLTIASGSDEREGGPHPDLSYKGESAQTSFRA